MDKEQTAFLQGIIVGIIVTAMITILLVNDKNGEITSGNNFIIKTATYKCSKTNELKEKE